MSEEAIATGAGRIPEMNIQFSKPLVLSVILTCLGVAIWSCASGDTIWNGADLLGMIMTIGGAFAVVRTNNKKERNK